MPHAFHIEDLYLFGCHYCLFNYLHLYPEGRLFLPQDPEFLFDKVHAQIASEDNNCGVQGRMEYECVFSLRTFGLLLDRGLWIDRNPARFGQCPKYSVFMKVTGVSKVLQSERLDTIVDLIPELPIPRTDPPQSQCVFYVFLNRVLPCTYVIRTKKHILPSTRLPI